MRVFLYAKTPLVFKSLRIITKRSYLAVTPFLVGVTGFEHATSASRTQRSTKLSHTPKCIYLSNYLNIIPLFEYLSTCFTCMGTKMFVNYLYIQAYF